MLPTEIVRNDRGADVCHRVVKKVVENIKGGASKGFHYVDAYCNQPVVLNISENRKICPSCDKQPPVGWVNPRTTNAAGTVLTPKELQECGLTEDPSLKPAVIKAVRKPKEAKKAVEAKVHKVKKDAVTIEVDLSALETAEDIAATLIRKASAALDELPVTNFAESKRLIRLQEKLEALLKV